MLFGREQRIRQKRIADAPEELAARELIRNSAVESQTNLVLFRWTKGHREIPGQPVRTGPSREFSSALPRTVDWLP